MRQFTATDTVVDLIESDYNTVPLLSRFSIPLGFGDKSIAEVCGEAGIDPDIFLFVVNFTLTGHISLHDESYPTGIVDFLLDAHSY
ncbi:MAG: hemerythrin domain-containing protein, partial [Paramuribaculum sp.]|nr:hemerythrin domain-containing protein [Paramuribaculum sp.]